ncbi:MAG: hypothetical protein RR413_09355 [Christensenellaceae bacterium]
MKLIKQVVSDLFKEIGWLVFYGFLTAMVIMAFILISLSYDHVASQNEAISRFVNNNVTMTQLKSTHFNITPKAAPIPFDPAEIESLDEYCADVFSENGNAGTFVLMPGRCGYQQVIILMGAYAELTPFSEVQSDAVTFAVSYDKKDVKSDIISLSGNDYPLHVAPSDMEIYHPLFYLNTASGVLDDTLFVFSHDLKAIQEIFPSSEYWELKGNAYFDRLIFKSATNQDIARMRNVITKNVGGYVSVQTLSDFLKSSTISGTRTHQTYMLFYITASLVLLGAMLINIYRVLKRKIPNYATHHLFGASDSFIFARMSLFVLLYHALPLGGTVFIMALNRMATPFNLFMVTLAVLAILFAVTSVVHKQFRAQFSQGLRRE